MVDTPEQHLSQDIGVQKHGAVTWIDVEAPTDKVFAQLEEQYHLHPLHLSESVQKVQHNQVEREDSYLFFVLHTPVLDPSSGKIEVSQVGIFLGKDYVITIRSGASPAITNLFSQCLEADAHRAAYFKQGSSYLLYTIIRKVLTDITNLTEEVESELDAIDDLVFDSSGSEALVIGRVRQKIVKLRRIIGPKRLILPDLAEQVGSFADKSTAKYYSNNTKTVNKLWEVIEEAKETVEIYKDADFTTSTEQTNKILAVLTIIFTLTIPVTVVGTLYGMNVPLPGGIEAGSWTFFGRFTTFLLLGALSLLIAVGMYAYFRSKKWF